MRTYINLIGLSESKRKESMSQEKAVKDNCKDVIAFYKKKPNLTPEDKKNLKEAKGRLKLLSILTKG